jgi:hypothetical protein
MTARRFVLRNETNEETLDALLQSALSLSDLDTIEINGLF